MIMKKLDEELASLATMSPAQLRAEWRRVHKTLPPDVSADLLTRGIAYRLQERRHGGLSSAVRRDIQQRAGELAKHGRITGEREISLRPGTRLSRDWRGRSHHVLVLEQGFMFEDQRYNSLSQIANAITGANWSGPRFFGLKQRPKPSQVMVEVSDG